MALRIIGNCDIRVWIADGRILENMEGSPETTSGQVSGWLTWSEMSLASPMIRYRLVEYRKNKHGDAGQMKRKLARGGEERKKERQKDRRASSLRLRWVERERESG